MFLVLFFDPRPRATSMKLNLKLIRIMLKIYHYCVVKYHDYVRSFVKTYTIVTSIYRQYQILRVHNKQINGANKTQLPMNKTKTRLRFIPIYNNNIVRYAKEKKYR